jgi:hypothetical protein
LQTNDVSLPLSEEVPDFQPLASLIQPFNIPRDQPGIHEEPLRAPPLVPTTRDTAAMSIIVDRVKEAINFSNTFFYPPSN